MIFRLSKNKKIIGLMLAIALILIGGFYVWANQMKKNEKKIDVASITTFEQCNDENFPIIRHYPDQCQTPDGRIFVNENLPSESELTQSELAIKTFMGDQNLELQYIGQSRHPANFAVLSNVKTNEGGFTADNPEEWDRPIYIFQQKNYINDRCEVYQYQVLIKTKQVVEIGIVYPEEFQQGNPTEMQEKRIQCSSYGSLETPLKTKDQIEQAAFAYFGRDPEHTKFMLRSDIQPEYIPSKPGAKNPAANEWKWEDKSVSLPNGLVGDPWSHPIARIIMSSGGKLIYYLSTTELFSN